jgi:hypothetical protein
LLLLQPSCRPLGLHRASRASRGKAFWKNAQNDGSKVRKEEQEREPQLLPRILIERLFAFGSTWGLLSVVARVLAD